MSAIVSGCLGFRAGKSKVSENSPRICDRELFVLLDTEKRWSPDMSSSCQCNDRSYRIILRSARSASGRWISSSIVWPRWLWCRSTKRTGHRCHKCSADSIFYPHNRQAASTEIPTKCCQRRSAGLGPLRKQVMSVRSVMAKDVSIC